MYVQLEHIFMVVYLAGMLVLLFMWRHENDRDSRWSIHERTHYVEPAWYILSFVATTMLWPIGVPVAYARSFIARWRSRRKWERLDREAVTKP
jgi:threonine/homoserine/homoserine lactone efflux protein